MISVIVTCYNLENEIENCIRSLQRQVFSDLEIIIVDDGSKDNSLSVLRKIESGDKRIKVVSQKNSGPSSARNLGLSLVKGNYVMFVDGDDYIDENYIQELASSIDKEPDLIIGGMRFVYPNNEVIDIKGISFEESYEDFIDNYYSRFINNRLIFGPVNKLYKSSLLEGVRFDESLEIREDGFFVLEFLKKTKKIVGNECTGYNYIQHNVNGSLVTKYHENEMKINTDFYNALLSFYNPRSMTSSEIKDIVPIFLNMDIGSIRKYYNSQRPTMNEGIKYIKKVICDDTFATARKLFFSVDPIKAIRFYRPAIMLHFINWIKIIRK